MSNPFNKVFSYKNTKTLKTPENVIICESPEHYMGLIQANRPAWLRLRKRNFKLSGTQVCPSVLLFKTVLNNLLYFKFSTQSLNGSLATSCVPCGCSLLLTIKTSYCQ